MFIYGVRFERRKVDKEQTWKLKHANSILEYLEYFCQISSKSILIISSYSVSKLVRFWDTLDYIYSSATLCWSTVCICSCTQPGLRRDAVEWIQNTFIYFSAGGTDADSHWLDVPDRVTFKLGLMTYRCLHGQAPRYLADHVTQIKQGSDTRVRTQKKPGGFFGYTHLKNPPQKTHTSTLT